MAYEKIDKKVIYKAVAILNRHREELSEEKIVTTLCDKYNYNYWEVKKALTDIDLYYGI